LQNKIPHPQVKMNLFFTHVAKKRGEKRKHRATSKKNCKQTRWHKTLCPRIPATELREKGMPQR
jgi:hypothetical protein